MRVDLKEMDPGFQIHCGENLGSMFSKHDFVNNCNFASDVPQLCKDEPCLLGVDEAGRGPVLGPMVYAICYCPLTKADDVKNLGCADSKTLTEEKREALFESLCKEKEFVGWAIEAISPNSICNGMLRRQKYSLNQLAQDATVALIQNAIELGVNLTEVYIDTVGPPEKYQERLSGIFPDINITVAKKADVLYPIVSAASICAKVSRDRALQTWTFQEELNITLDQIGSGYPNDPVTKKFLAENIDPVFGFPHLVRFSWSTADKILQDNANLVEWEDVDEEGTTPANNMTITSFFTSKLQKQKKHAFFSDRNLSHVDTLS